MKPLMEYNLLYLNIDSFPNSSRGSLSRVVVFFHMIMDHNSMSGNTY